MFSLKIQPNSSSQGPGRPSGPTPDRARLGPRPRPDSWPAAGTSTRPPAPRRGKLALARAARRRGGGKKNGQKARSQVGATGPDVIHINFGVDVGKPERSFVPKGAMYLVSGEVVFDHGCYLLTKYHAPFSTGAHSLRKLSKAKSSISGSVRELLWNRLGGGYFKNLIVHSAQILVFSQLATSYLNNSVLLEQGRILLGHFLKELVEKGGCKKTDLPSCSSENPLSLQTV